MSFRNWAVLLAAVTLVASIAAWQRAAVKVDYHILAAEPENINTKYEPVRFGDEVPAATVTAVLAAGEVHPKLFEIKADDCLAEFQFNGILLPLNYPLCSYPESVQLNLGGLIRPGRNVVRAVVKNKGGHGGFVISPSRMDSMVKTRALLVLLALAVFIWAALNKAEAYRSDKVVWTFCVLGIVLRVGYYLFTPYWTRGYDYFGHLEYIDFVRSNWTLPPSAEGWMYYQPPLYYFVSAALVTLADLVFPGRFNSADAVQFFGAVCSIVFLLLLIKLLTELFFGRTQRRIAAGLGAVWPGLVLFASRINNDVLLAPLLLVSLLFLLKRWRRESKSAEVRLAIFIGLSILTKSNALVVLAAALVAILAKRPIASLKSAASILLIVVLLTGPYYLCRSLKSDALMLGGNLDLDDGLHVETTPRSLLAFSPNSLFEQPFTDPREDGFRKDVFLEYWLRTSLFGEFQFNGSPEIFARASMVCAVLIIMIAMLGLAMSRRKRDDDDLLMLLVFVAAAAAHLLYRLSVPFSSGQDFRYTWMLLVPVWYFYARVVEYEWKAVRASVVVVSTMFVVSASCFICFAWWALLPMWR
ncbi:MAG: glycosyltransferase family 39 protein [Bdellovibrionales bacterium]|nr:glycosyltransferase family 39 protein [Bdellovibrionales bacterium]